MSATVAALLGALIGSLASIVTTLVQGHLERKRELTRLATEAAIAQHQQAVEIAKLQGNAISPLSTYIYYHMEVLKLVERDEISLDAMREINRDALEMDRLAAEVTEELEQEAKEQEATTNEDSDRHP